MQNNKWYKRFIELAEQIATWSRDPSTKVGALIVDNKSILAVGFNGLPRSVLDSDERLNDRELKYAMTVHAEANALVQCAKLGLRTEGCYLFCTHPPCANCAGLIIQSGITKLVIKSPSDEFKERWKKELDFAKIMCIEAGIDIELVK